jgi:hypothetical protein
MAFFGASFDLLGVIFCALKLIVDVVVLGDLLGDSIAQ